MADTSNVKILADREDIVAIADAVRSKTGISEKMTLGEIASGINGITGGDEDLDAELTTQENLIAELSGILDTKAGGEQATPVISVNSTNGLITATAGTKTSTHQLAFQAAKTITPGTTNQTAVSSGYYTGGAVMVKGDSNLVAGNIKSGVSIFGVNGNYAGSGGDTSMEDGLVARTLTSYANDRVKTIGTNAFYSCYKLTTVSFPVATTIGGFAFYSCSNLTSVSFPVATSIGYSAFCYCFNLTIASFPAATTIGNNAFSYCSKLTTVSFPAAKTIGNSAFGYCYSLTTVSFPAATTIGSYAFDYCYNLKSLYLTGSSVCTLAGSRAFSSTPIGGYSKSAGTYGSIYVPASLLASYKTATNWAYFSSRFVGI